MMVAVNPSSWMFHMYHESGESVSSRAPRVNNETPMVLFHDLESTWYVPAVDLRDCGDKVGAGSGFQRRCVDLCRCCAGGEDSGICFWW